LILENGTTRVIEGNYETWCMLQEAARQRELDRASAEAQASRARESRSGRPRRARRFPYRKIELIEADIAACESRIEALHFRLADPAVHRDGQAVVAAKNELASEQGRLHELYEHWEEAHELN
jgi:hypothetical protein